MANKTNKTKTNKNNRLTKQFQPHNKKESQTKDVFAKSKLGVPLARRAGTVFFREGMKRGILVNHLGASPRLPFLVTNQEIL